VLGKVDGEMVAGNARVETDAAAVRDAGRCVGRWERVPRRCISRDTSLAS
jgi:hypothetical protein